MDLSSVVEAYAEPVTVTRTPFVTYDDTSGDPVVPSSSTFTVLACSQKASGRELKRVQEGLRTEEARIFFTTSELFTKTATQEPDAIAYRGETYQVAIVDRWDDLGNYWRVVAGKVGAL